MKKFAHLALITLVGAAGIVASSAPASAFIACNREGDCWHVQDRVRYPRAPASPFTPTTGIGASAVISASMNMTAMAIGAAESGSPSNQTAR